MTSQVLNFLWLNLDLPAPPDPVDGSIREPLPAKYIENIRKAGDRHPEAEIVFWVDSKRLTERQMDYLKQSVENGMSNVHLKDLRDIPAYGKESLYNEAETDPGWRNEDKNSLIWRQVDAAKILVSLQGDYDQTFFADLDHAHLDIASKQVQDMLEQHGIFVGSGSDDKKCVSIENQLWGFNRSRRDFFERYYAAALYSAYTDSNAFDALFLQVRRELQRDEKIPLIEISLPINDDGSAATHPGHEWRAGDGFEATPASITASQITDAFNQNSSEINAPAAQRKGLLSKIPFIRNKSPSH